MKKNFFRWLTSLIILLQVTISCASEQEMLKIGVITDMHYLSESIMDKGSAAQLYVKSSGRDIVNAPVILDTVLDEYMNSDIDVLLIPGDLTKDGEEQSLLDISEKLMKLKAKGIRVYTIPGNHDINMPNSLGYKDNSTYKVKRTEKDLFSKISDNLHENILDKDTSSLSYVAELNKDTWLIAIDVSRYDEYTTHSISGGKIKPSTEKWVLENLEKANGENKTVIGMMHHGLVEHIMYQEMFFSQYLVEDWKRIATLFADHGMKVVFTGHFHANDITRFTTEKGNQIYDIETGSLTSYPFPYRFITLGNKGMDIETRNITSVPENPNLVEENKQYLRKIAENMAMDKVKSVGFKISDDYTKKLSEIIGNLFLLHVAGDEVMTDDLKKQLEDMAKLMGDTAPLDTEEIQLDFFPADNNVRIDFSK